MHDGVRDWIQEGSDGARNEGARRSFFYYLLCMRAGVLHTSVSYTPPFTSMYPFISPFI